MRNTRNDVEKICNSQKAKKNEQSGCRIPFLLNGIGAKLIRDSAATSTDAVRIKTSS